MDPISMDTLLAKLEAARSALRDGPLAAAKAPAKTDDFSSMLKSTLSKIDASQNSANKLAEAFQLGDPKVSLEDTMVALQKANVEFQAAIQVRNRVVAAYHDVMNLQI